MTRLFSSPAHLDRLRAILSTPPQVDPSDPAVASITAWLARLLRLEGVPFEHLVPDPAMLPAESIRFFVVDDNWTTALVDGAFSIGNAAIGTRASGNGGYGDGATATPVHTLKSLAGAKMAAGRGGAVATTGGFSGTVSGFLLRSAVLTAWPNIEIRGFKDKNHQKPATTLRFDILAPGLAIGLFDDLVQAVVFAEPSETLHFGIEEGAAKKPLRYVNSISGHTAGDQIYSTGGSDPVTAPVPFRSGSSTVIDVTELANSVLTTLQQNDGITSGNDYTAAQFAMELVEGTAEVTFTIADDSGGTGGAG